MVEIVKSFGFLFRVGLKQFIRRSAEKGMKEEEFIVRTDNGIRD